MKGHFKLLLTAGLIVAALCFTVSPGNAQADVIETPAPATNIKQINAGNVLTDYTQKKLNAVDNQSPIANMDRKYNQTTIDPTSTNPGDTFSTINGSTSSNSFKTKWYLPDGFNVTNYQHGNFQSVAVDDAGNVYFVESNGSDTNLGVIIKFNIAKLQQLGADKDVMALWNAFNYFNPYTDEGVARNQQYENDYQQMKGPFDQIKLLNQSLDQEKSSMNTVLNNEKNAKKWAKHWQKRAQKADKPAKAKLAKWQAAYKTARQKITGYQKLIKQTSAKIAGYEKQVSTVKQQDPQLFKYADIAQAAQISPQVDIGHGQTLTFNPQNKHLYMVEDNTLTDLRNRDENNTVLELDPETMNPIRQYNFKMFHGDSANLQLHTLAFDKDGNAYWGRKNGMGYMFFFGRLDEHSVHFQASPSYVKTRGSSPNQGTSANPANDRLYFVSDDILTSIPTGEIRDGSFTPSDIHYSVFNSKKEWESLSFDQNGRGYLLALWPAQLMTSTGELD